MIGDLDIRSIRTVEIDDSFRIMKQLRPAYSNTSFREHLTSMYRSGYQLVGAFVDNKLYGLVGFRPVKTFARGDYIHIDDLVVDESCRRNGVGKALIDFVYSYSRQSGYSKIFLDARPESIDFYERNNYVYHTSPSMKIHVE